MATKKHQVLLANDENVKVNDEFLQQLFLDLEMAILGK
jgi:hypothetical protein